MTSAEVEIFLAHHGVKGQKWGVRKDQPESGMSRLMTNPYVRLAKGSKEGNAVNLAISAASIAAVAVSAPVSMPLLVGGTLSARIAIKSYEAYKIFYDKHPSKLLPKPKATALAKYKVGEDMKNQLVAKYGHRKMSTVP